MIDKKIIYGAAGAAAAIIMVALFLTTGQTPHTQYLEYNSLLKEKLADRQILMSSPIRLQKQEDVEKYCTFFTSQDLQKLAEYCTSTEIKDHSGRFLGNIHMVGSPYEPKVILTLIQTDPQMTQIESVKTIFETVIQNTVCNCWEKVKPDGMANVSQWVEGMRQFHQGDTQHHSKSKRLVLESKAVQMELTTNKDGYLWQLFIYK
ncbi:MAG TPA: hypothetical protein VNK44_08845 [Candidatus Nitrosotenuis sp.]|nr:hypothetical protein [Candidatus Nitrosotenuis sp.]